MTPERSIPWYRERYIWVCVVVAFIGLGVVASDSWARQAKRDLIAAKADADVLFEGRQYEQAAARYDVVLAHTARSSDAEVRAALDDARRLRDESLEKLAQERARLAAERARVEAEEARRREFEEAERQWREAQEAFAKVETSPEYRSMLQKAEEHEERSPTLAASYYRDIVVRFPGSAQSRAAAAKAESLSETKGSGGGYSGGVATSTGGNLCGATTADGTSCRNPVKAGSSRCYLHGPTVSSSGVHVGPRGGVYHYSKSGKKVYHKRK